MITSAITKIVRRQSSLNKNTRSSCYYYDRYYYRSKFSFASNAREEEITAKQRQQKRSLTLDDIKQFEEILSHDKNRLIVNNSSNNKEAKIELEAYNNDWTKHYTGKSKLVLKPKTTLEVSEIVSYCYKHRLRIVAQGGNTGLVGGSIPIDDEIIVNLSNMNGIESFDEDTGILHCEAGCIVQNMQEYVKEFDYLLPIDLGSKGSCVMGGVVSTNAGGQYYYRYGSIHSNLLGIEVVTTSSKGVQVLNLQNKNPKDNTGYHLKNLFVGSEGTLGIITKVIMSCPTYPKSKQVVFLVCHSFQQVMAVVKEAKKQLNEILSALEYMDRTVFDIVLQQHPNRETQQQFSFQQEEGANATNFVLLLETHGSNSKHDVEKLEAFLGFVMEEDFIEDALLARNEMQSLQMWNIRDACNPSIQQIGYTYKYDISIPTKAFHTITLELQQALKQEKLTHEYIVTSWGHILDGNLHLNITTPDTHSFSSQVEKILTERIYHAVLRLGGSISAEHGIGQLKRGEIGNVHSKNVLATFYELKDFFDGRGIFNPGKYLPCRKN